MDQIQFGDGNLTDLVSNSFKTKLAGFDFFKFQALVFQFCKNLAKLQIIQ